MNIPENQILYVDLPDLSETFVDSLGTMIFDGQSARIELRVTRMDEIKPGVKPTAKRYPACRLVLTPDAFLQLSTQLRNLVEMMIKQGTLKPIEPEKGTVH